MGVVENFYKHNGIFLFLWGKTMKGLALIPYTQGEGWRGGKAWEPDGSVFPKQGTKG